MVATRAFGCRRGRRRAASASLNYVSALALATGVAVAAGGLRRAAAGPEETSAGGVRVIADDGALGERVAREVGLTARAFFERLSPRLAARGADAPALLEVRLYDREVDFRDCADRDGSAACGGYSRAGRLVGWRGGASERDLLRMVRHEVVHHLVAWAATDAPFAGYGSAGVPRTIDEGLAELFEAGWPERPNLEHAPLLADLYRRGELPTLREACLGISTGLDRPREYAVGYALAAFVLEGEGRARVLREALAARRAGPGGRGRQRDEASVEADLLAGLTRLAGGEEAAERAWRRAVRRLASWEDGIVQSAPEPAGGGGADRARGLVQDLGASEYTVRAGASESLQSLGEEALPALREAMRSPEPEVRVRARTLAREMLGAGRGNWWSKSRAPDGD